jgi:hypothetical protein
MHCEIPDIKEEWIRRMRRGDFESAWRLSDAVLSSGYPVRCNHLPRHFQSVWDGRPLDGRRVLIRCYHGLGDTIHFIRYAPLVKSRASQVILLAQSELIPLLRTARGIDRVTALDSRENGLEYDIDIEVMELPHLFRTTLATIPAQVPYLFVPAGNPSKGQSARREAGVTLPSPFGRAKGEGRPHDNLHVGIVWAAGDWDARRSIPVEFLAPLGAVPGVKLYVFQRGAALSDSPPWPALTPRWHDILEEARLMSALDLMISVDSLPAHLAGALAVPVWTLLHRDADWRWLERRNDSPWYPTMRLFRQERAGDWPPVIAKVASELASLSAAAARGEELNHKEHSAAKPQPKTRNWLQRTQRGRL